MLSKHTALQGQEHHRQPTWASEVLSMVSGIRASQLLGIEHNRNRKPCLANMLLEVCKAQGVGPAGRAS